MLVNLFYFLIKAVNRVAGLPFSFSNDGEDFVLLKYLSKIKKEVEDAKNTFKKYKWPIIDVTRKSVEETAASIIKIYEIFKNNG